MPYYVFLLLLIGQLSWPIRASSSITNPIPDDTNLREFYDCLLKGGVEASKFVPRDLRSENYISLNKQWNLRLRQSSPRAYFLPKTSQDVAQAVKCGIRADIRVIPNSGGHSFEGVGYGTDDQIVIDFRSMNEIRMAPGGVAYLEPGVNLAQAGAYLWEHGGYSFPMGTCLTVGIGGHVIGGGHGWYTGIYGLAADNALEFELVDGQGNILKASDSVNPDLFWALRGSGPGYIGIVTRVKVKLFEASKLQMTMVFINYNVRDFSVGFLALQNFQQWSRENDQPSGLLGFTMASDTYNQTIPSLPPGFAIAALHIQDPSTDSKSDNNSYLQAIRKHFPAPGIISVIPLTFLQQFALTASAPVILPHFRKGGILAEIGSIANYYGELPVMDEEKILAFLKLIRKGTDAPRYFKAKGMYTKKMYFTMEEMAHVQKVVNEFPQGNMWMLGVTWQGKVEKIPRNATAYVHRDIGMEIVIQYEGSPDPKYVTPGLKFLYDLHGVMKFMDSGETYQNTPDLDEHDHLDRFYKENLRKLVEIKAKFDPNNYFVSSFSLPTLVE